MRLICPSCGAMHSAEAWANDADARQCLQSVAALPSSVARNILPYLSLFRPAYTGGKGYRGLIWGRALRLAGEVVQMVADTHVQWDGKVARPIGPETWGRAMERMVDRPPRRLPIDSHGYLRRIAYELADEADRAAEVARNQAERNGSLAARIAGERKPSGGGDGMLGHIPTREEIRAMREAARRKGAE